MGNHQRKKQAAAEFNAKRAAELERLKREREEYEAWAKTPEGRAARKGSAMRFSMVAAIAAGAFR